MYFYDQSGIRGAVINGEEYYFAKDALGNVVEIARVSDNYMVAVYEYDAWGNYIVIDGSGKENTDPNFIGNLNPFRYRGYYYDTDLKMYYLQTRWYDPEVGRFINLDQIEYLNPETANGLNLYAYCGNNPVMGYDPMGTSILGLIGIAILSIGTLLALYGDSQKTLIDRKEVNINGDNPGGSINVTIGENYIEIIDSYKIHEKQEMRDILSYIMSHEDYMKYGYYRSMESYIEEWRAHNLVYGLGIYKLLTKLNPDKFNPQIEDPTKDVNLDRDPDRFSRAYGLGSFLYWLLGGILEI